MGNQVAMGKISLCFPCFWAVWFSHIWIYISEFSVFWCVLLSIAMVSNKVNDKGEFPHTLDRCLSYGAFSNECSEERKGTKEWCSREPGNLGWLQIVMWVLLTRSNIALPFTCKVRVPAMGCVPSPHPLFPPHHSHVEKTYMQQIQLHRNASGAK